MAEYNNGYYGNYSSTDYNAKPTYRQADQKKIEKKPKDKGILIPVIITAIVLVAFVFVAGLAVDETEQIEQAAFRQYADEQYYEVFGHSGKEEGILLTFVANETADDYYTVAVPGADVPDDIYWIFNGDSDYVYDMEWYIDRYDYSYGLDEDYCYIISQMTDYAAGYGYENMLGYNAMVNEYLEEFTRQTAVPIVLLLEYDYNIVGEETVTKYDDILAALVLVIMFMFPVMAAVVVMKLIRRRNGTVSEKKRWGRKEQTDKCDIYGCDGRIDKNKKPPWEY